MKYLTLLLLVPLTAYSANKEIFPHVEGWNKSDNIQTFENDYLWDYINGAAESYHAYDFEVLHVCDYMKSNDTYVTVEIYKHNSPENAYGIYSAERPQTSNFQEIGAEGYYEQGILNFVKGNQYVKMRSSGQSITKDDMLSLAGEVAKELPGNTMLPKELTLFPGKGKIPHSTLFVGENFIGYSSLNDAYIADYKLEDKEFRVFVIARNSGDILDNLLKDYISRRTEMEVLPLNEMVTVEDPYNGTIYMMKKGNYVLGTINLKDQAIAEKLFK
jgi:hypothetical protein